MEINFTFNVVVLLLFLIALVFSITGTYLNDKNKIKKESLEHLFKLNAYTSLFAMFLFLGSLYFKEVYPNKNLSCKKEVTIDRVLVKNYNNMNMVLTSDGEKRRSEIAEEGTKVCVETSEDIAFYSFDQGVYYKNIVVTH